ncbi:1615_t:CDS:2, partial [Gigaspora rosea]
IINIQNNDDWCLRWCVLGVLHPVKIHPKRNPHQLYGGFMEELNMDDIPIPVPVSTPVYKKFEANNPEIRLCIYEWHNQNECLDFCYVLERRCEEYKQGENTSAGLNNAPQRAQMPVKNKSIKAFYNHKCMQPNQYRIFWNLEMLTEKLTPEEKMKLTHTERLQMHKPCGYCYVVIRMDSSLNYKI